MNIGVVERWLSGGLVEVPVHCCWQELLLDLLLEKQEHYHH